LMGLVPDKEAVNTHHLQPTLTQTHHPDFNLGYSVSKTDLNFENIACLSVCPGASCSKAS
jgi:hypothetical protein